MLIPNARETSQGDAHDQAIAALYATGYWLLSVDCPRAALDVFRTLILIAPGDERGWLGLGRAHEELDSLEIAGHLYALAARAAPRSCRCHIAHARVLERLGLHTNARAALDAAEQVAGSPWSDDQLAILIEAERQRLS
jgi:hypothetical protein